jgi:hypothetical protein
MKQITLIQPASIRGIPRDAGYVIEIGKGPLGSNIVSEPCALGLIATGKAKDSTVESKITSKTA